MKNLLDTDRENQLTLLCKVINIKISNFTLLHQALTHSSFANESKGQGIDYNERLEFLGDAVLDLVISDYLFRHFPNLPEGELTKARAMVVCEPTLARHASNLKLGQYLLLGKGEASSGGRERISILADAFEAVIGAIYLDSGFADAASFVLEQLAEDLVLIERGDYQKDYKTLLQEVVQKKGDSKISYEIIGEWGPDHDKTFDSAVIVNSNHLGHGTGRSKKEAEQRAARQALIKLDVISNR